MPVKPVAETASPVAVPDAVRAVVAGNGGAYEPEAVMAASRCQSWIFQVSQRAELLTSCAVICSVLNDRVDLSFSGAAGTVLDTAVTDAVAKVLHATQTSGVVWAGATKLCVLVLHVAEAGLLWNSISLESQMQEMDSSTHTARLD